ncbi:hydroxyacid dehydrogenase [Ovoidimarina sediminis]|uniref:hydroxyacid dehydrogenase n=1 Tax=Ovoidimarina sediminis TaxID=3079856 RepID=UPI002915A97F|nr:hydroxyacid dehydrogenase [Rhodophyticola sp. MJ-SS7]MDU8942095.1 hydroxyacid dehydrogenase [Rhodophyticola sp. MJ-SS7]
MILITEFMDEAAVERLSSAHSTRYVPDLADRQGDIRAMMPGVQALIVRNRTRVTAELIAEAPDLKMVGRLGVGLDNIDLDACAARGIEVIPATGANTLSVAEYVVTNALILLRDAYMARDEMMSGAWPRGTCGAGREVRGRRLGLVGFGAIAQETARLALPLGMTVAGYDPYLSADDPAWAGTERMDLDELISTSEVLSLHVPLTDATHHIINAGMLARMPAGSVLINAARGGIVDETALCDALRSGHLSGAALDVFESEPLTATSARKFEGLQNLILTPHIAGVTEDSNVRVSGMIADEVLKRL